MAARLEGLDYAARACWDAYESDRAARKRGRKMNNKGSLAGLRDACLQEQAARAAKLTDAQKREAWDAARGVVSKTLDKIPKKECDMEKYEIIRSDCSIYFYICKNGDTVLTDEDGNTLHFATRDEAQDFIDELLAE